MRLPAASESYESVRVAAYWFAALLHVVGRPSSYSPDWPRPRGISRTDLAAKLATQRQSSLAVPPLYRVSPALPGIRVSTNATSHGVPARPAHRAAGVRLTRESQILGTFRLQGFAPSCRFTPPEASQVYFTLVTLIGFRPSGAFPLKKPCHLVGVHRTLVAFLPYGRR
jgi:hypothetical protein